MSTTFADPPDPDDDVADGLACKISELAALDFVRQKDLPEDQPR